MRLLRCNPPTGDRADRIRLTKVRLFGTGIYAGAEGECLCFNGLQYDTVGRMCTARERVYNAMHAARAGRLGASARARMRAQGCGAAVHMYATRPRGSRKTKQAKQL